MRIKFKSEDMNSAKWADDLGSGIGNGQAFPCSSLANGSATDLDTSCVLHHGYAGVSKPPEIICKFKAPLVINTDHYFYFPGITTYGNTT
jgi:hypothetical protein